MNPRIAAVVFAGLVALAAGTAALAADSPPTPTWVAESRTLGQQLMVQLRKRLASAVSEQGPAAAIDVCRVAAPAIAADLSDDAGAVVRRTALRVRNPANAPDSFELDVLEDFDERIRRGEPVAGIEIAWEHRVDGTLERRYMKPIVAEPLCLACHGSSLAPDVSAAIARAYPEDEATGFEVGDLRGALSITWRNASDTGHEAAH